MANESDNVATLKDAYLRWHDSKAGSVDHWLNLMTDDVQFRSLAAGAVEMQFIRPSCCKDDVKQYFTGLTSAWEMIYYRVDEYIAQGDRPVSPSRKSLSNTKRPERPWSPLKPTSTDSATARFAIVSSFTIQQAR